jgi:esterase
VGDGPNEPTRGSVAIGDVEIAYLDWGEPSPGAPALLLVHGTMGCAADWSRVAPALAGDYRVIALDQRGHGASSHPPAPGGYRTEDYLADIEGLADALGLGRFAICGHSMGGHNTIGFAARHPDRVLCALANDILPSPDVPIDDWEARLPNRAQPLFATIEEYVEQRRNTVPFAPVELLHEEAGWRLQAVDGGLRAVADPRAAFDWEPADLWEEAAGIRCPILYIRAGRSPGLDAATLQRMVMQTPSARSVSLELSGHDTYLDREEEFISMARGFFAAHIATPVG